MTATTALHVACRGRLLSRLTPSTRSSWRAFSSSCSTTRHLSSLTPLQVQEEEEEDVSWEPYQAQSLPLLSSAVPTQQQATEQEQDDSSNDPHVSPSELVYTGDHRMPITSTLHIVTPGEDAPRGTWPVYRLMDDDGHFRDSALDGYAPRTNETRHSPPPLTPSSLSDLDSLKSHLQQEYPQFQEEFQRSALLQEAHYEYPDTQSRNTLLRAHRQMMRLREMDAILQNAQRQGRISFYMTCRGEEAIHIGAASALEREDTVLAQYREAGILMWRGFTLEQFTNQCFSNDGDLGKGRQMPVHYGSRALNYHTISSPLGTQLPQAVGVAYHMKLKSTNSVTACFFGDGCASTTDFHSACNFAATLQVPLLFLCRNNGYAISTPVTDQYAGDGIVSRAPGYGMAGIRVDGNDLFAVHEAVRAAKEYALEKCAPVFIELMTYRQGHHSTSDDSTRYREHEEVFAHKQHGDPVKRMNAFLLKYGIVDEEWLVSSRDEEKLAVLQAMEAAEQRPKPPLTALFEDVYDEMPPHLQQQEDQLLEHVAKYPKHYKS